MNPHDFTLATGASLREAMEAINRGGRGIALLLDEDARLDAVITDGDIRRAILAGKTLAASVDELIEQKKQLGLHPPVTVPQGTDRDEMLALMHERSIAQLPLVDDEGRVVQLRTLAELLPEHDLPVEAVIMAGGFGRRLRPLTDNVPKPMLPIGGKPLMERTIRNLRHAGVRRINVTTHYLPEKITQHFGDGSDFDVELNYVAEDQPLGTAGAVGLLGRRQEPLLVMNGDILTQVDFRALLDFHRQRAADLTVGVRQYDLQIPYGVIEADNGLVGRLTEKPTQSFLVNAGVYLLEPSACAYIPPGERFDMTELIEQLLADGRTVASFPIVEYWLDIGQHDDFQRAQQDAREMKWAA